MNKEIKKGIRLDKFSIGCFLAYAYIFTSYIAQDILLSSKLNSLFLYAFLLSSAYILITKMKLDKRTLDFIVWYLLFMLFSVVLMLNTPSIPGVFGSFYAMIVAFLVSLSLQFHVTTEKKFRAMCRCYAISAVAFVVLLFFTGNLVGDAGNRLGQEILGNANIFASMMMVASMYTVWIIVYDAKTFLSRIVWLAVLGLDLYSLMLSGGRKFFIIPFIFLYILLLFKADKKGRRHIFAYTVVFAAVVIVTFIAMLEIPVLYNAIGVRMEGLIENLMGKGGDSSSEIREKIRNLAFGKWLDKPFFGYGFDSFKYLALSEVGYFFYSHCNFTELLYCGGVFYFILYYCFFLRLLKKSLCNKNIPAPYKAFTVGVVLSLLVFDYGAVSYNATTQICMLMMANCATFVSKTPVKGEY